MRAKYDNRVTGEGKALVRMSTEHERLVGSELIIRYVHWMELTTTICFKNILFMALFIYLFVVGKVDRITS